MYFHLRLPRSLSSTYRSATSVLVVDTPGFQNPGTCGRQSGSSFEDLCYNYTQEKLQLLFHDLVFTMPQDRYSQVCRVIFPGVDFNLFMQPSVPLMGHWQTVQTQIKCSKMVHLIRVYSVCIKQMGISPYRIKKKSDKKWKKN